MGNDEIVKICNGFQVGNNRNNKFSCTVNAFAGQH